MNEQWWQRAVVYQIYPKSFQDTTGSGTGDIPGITKRLPYLAKLGIDVIWLSPVYESPMDDNGYDISDYRAIWPGFGTMDDFDQMLETAHSLGIKIVMDLVVNHSSDEHEWFKQSRSSRDNPYRDYYYWRDAVDGHEPSNMGGVFGGSIWEWDETTQQYYLHCFSKKQPDLNWENPRVADEVFDMMDWWLSKGVDGFRMDVIGMIAKDTSFPSGEPGPTGYAPLSPLINDDGVHPHLQDMRRRVLSKYDTMTVGEVSGATVETAKKYANLDGSELSMVFQFEHVSLTGDPDRGKWVTDKPRLVDLKQVFNRWETGLDGVAWNSLFWDNHDQPRAVSRWGNDDPQWREKSAKMLATCLHLMQGTPYVPRQRPRGTRRLSHAHAGLRVHARGGHGRDARDLPRQRTHAHAVGCKPEGRLHHGRAVASRESELRRNQRRGAGRRPSLGVRTLPGTHQAAPRERPGGPWPLPPARARERGALRLRAQA